MKTRRWRLLDVRARVASLLARAATARRDDPSANGSRGALHALAALSLLALACQPVAHAPSRVPPEAGLGLDASSERFDSAPAVSVDAASASGLEARGGADGALPIDMRASTSTLPWLRGEVTLEADGRSAPLAFALGALPRPVFALRTYAADPQASRALCFQLEEVRADETTWVPAATSADYGDYCTGCAQRVAVGSGYGLFVLPSALAQPERFGTLALRIALRDCLTLTPLSVGTPRPRSLVVESASFSAPAPDTTLALPLLIVQASPHTFSAGAQLDQAFARVQTIWRAAGIELVLRGPFPLPRPVAPVVYGATDRAPLAKLARDVEDLAREANIEPWVPWLALTPCLVRNDPLVQGMSQPLATTTHVPGGFAVNEEPDGIFVAGELCGGLTPGARYLESETLAAVMAHELGHYLGLFHVQEPDGREDALADTRAEEPNLMQARPATGASGLTQSQIAVARRHPSLAVANQRGR